jgi:hypothetical protein
MLLVHPDGLGSKATNEEINISFDPVPDFAGIAKAAAGGDLFAAKIDKVDALEETLKKAIEAVQGGQSAVFRLWLFIFTRPDFFCSYKNKY